MALSDFDLNNAYQYCLLYFVLNIQINVKQNITGTQEPRARRTQFPLLPHTHLFGKYLEKAEFLEQRSINQEDKGMSVATFHSRSSQLGPTLHPLKTQAPPQHSDPHLRLCSITQNHGFHYWLHKFKQKTYLANSSEFILKIFS